MTSPGKLTTHPLLPSTSNPSTTPNLSNASPAHGHKDLVLAASYNLYGTRLATASADHTLRVWDKRRAPRPASAHPSDPVADEWILTDAWRAHDGEVFDVHPPPSPPVQQLTPKCKVKWTSPLLGAHLGSISSDTTFKLWSEDATAPLRSGTRFTHSATIASKSDLPHAGLAFRCATAPGAETLLALITRSGNLAVLEPRDSARLATTEWIDWTGGRDLHVVRPPPGRGEEAGFSVAWHDETVPCWSALAGGLERRSAGLVVGAMEWVKVFRTVGERGIALVAEVRVPSLVRSVDWANGACRGWDMLAAAGKDGIVRVLDVRAAEGGGATVRGSGSTVLEEERAGGVPSGIGAGLAGLPAREEVDVERGGFRQTVSVGAELKGHRGGVWKVGFSFGGMCCGEVWLDRMKADVHCRRRVDDDGRRRLD